jgi:ABC-type Zn uptake system ZnuABC Zn-binding protein ZnuA
MSTIMFSIKRLISVMIALLVISSLVACQSSANRDSATPQATNIVSPTGSD